jgi:hypothetical protein
MPDAGKKLDIYINGNRAYQKIDGFGVNINSKYWEQGRLIPTMDLLREDLGATLYRVDIWGKSNWVDPTSQVGLISLNESNYSAIYQGDIFQRGWAMMRHLNTHGIEPYLTASGDVPTWMLGPDRKSLANYDAFCEMQVSMVDWAKNKEHLRFTLFGPLNEIDVGSPEGPSVNPVEFVKVLEILDEKLTRRELGDIRLVGMNNSYRSYYLNVILGGFQDNVIAGKVAYFRTSENENCYRIGEIPVRGANYPFTGIDAQVPPGSIFTLATV